MIRRDKIGIRPTAVLATVENEPIYVADTFGDAVVVQNRLESFTISLGPQPESTAVVRGERLFFDAQISHGKWMSCHSCHSDGHTSDFLSDTLGDGTYGTPKRIPSLRGVGATGPWGWNGKFPNLEDQVRQSIETAMRGKALADGQVEDLVEYLKSLTPAPAIIASPDEKEQASIERGRAVFEKRNCQRCHAPPAYTSAEAFDVGIKDELGQTHFNPPSLLGVGQRSTLFHNASGESLEKILAVQKHQVGDDLTVTECLDLVAFLRSL